MFGDTSRDDAPSTPAATPEESLPNIGSWTFTSAYTTFIVVWKFLVQLLAHVPMMGSALKKTPDLLERLVVVTERLDVLLGRTETLLGGSEQIYNFAIDSEKHATARSIFPPDATSQVTLSRPVMDTIDIFVSIVSHGSDPTWDLVQSVMTFAMDPSSARLEHAMRTFEPHLRRKNVEKSTMSLLALFVSLSLKVCDQDSELLLRVRQWIERYEDYIPHELYVPMASDEQSESDMSGDESCASTSKD